MLTQFHGKLHLFQGAQHGTTPFRVGREAVMILIVFLTFKKWDHLREEIAASNQFCVLTLKSISCSWGWWGSGRKSKCLLVLG